MQIPGDTGSGARAQARRRNRHSSNSRSLTRRRRSSERCRSSIQVIKQRGLVRQERHAAAKAGAAANKGLQGLLNDADTSAKKADSTKKGAVRLRRTRRTLPIRSSCSRAARCRRSLEQGQMPGEFYVESEQGSDARQLSWPTRPCRPRCLRARTSSRAPIRRRCRASGIARTISSTPSRSSPATTSRMRVRTRARPTARSSSSS